MDRIIYQTIYCVITIFVGGISYIYITAGLHGDSVMGVLSIVITCVIAAALYRVILQLIEESSRPPRRRRNSRSTAAPSRPSQPATPPFEVKTVLCLPPVVSEEEKKRREEEEKQRQEEERLRLEEEEKQEQEEKRLRLEAEQKRQEMIEQLKVYTQHVFEDYFPEKEMPILLQIVDDYAEGKIACTACRCALSDINGLRPKEFYHYGWNLWKRLDSLDRRATCRFLKNAFPEILKGISVDTIYRKMTNNDFDCIIKNIKIEEPLY